MNSFKHKIIVYTKSDLNIYKQYKHINIINHNLNNRKL